MTTKTKAQARLKPLPRPGRLPKLPSGMASRLRSIRLFLCDVDGILTDASVFMGDGGEFKQFDVRDGFGLRLLQRNGLKVGWISNRPSNATTRRAEELKVDFLQQLKGSKLEAATAILQQGGFDWGSTAYMGDDLVDLGLFRRVGLAVTVPGALDEVRQLADYVTRNSGGRGAVRELAELILKAQGKWGSLVEDYAA